MINPPHPVPYRPPELRQGWETWLSGTTTGEAIGWACKELTVCCILLVGALRNHHAPAAREAICQMHLIVARLEEFIYYKFPDWKKG